VPSSYLLVLLEHLYHSLVVYWFKRKYRQIKKTIDFLPLIWKSYDFDYSYALNLFKKQLEYTAKELESERANTVSAPTNAQKIRTAIRLMNKVYEEEYAHEYMSTIDKLYGPTHYDFVETDEVSELTGEKLYQLKLRNENAVDEQHQKEIDEVRHQMMLLSQDKQKRAHKLLWDFIEHNIQRWWD